MTKDKISGNTQENFQGSIQDNMQCQNTQKQNQYTYQAPNIQDQINKFKLLGLPYHETIIDESKNISLHFFSFDEYNHFLFIPDNVVRLNENLLSDIQNNRYSYSNIYVCISGDLFPLEPPKGTLHVVGGKNLQNANGLFFNFRIFKHEAMPLFDFTCFHTEDITTMDFMFSCFHTDGILDLSSFHTNNVTSMFGMFSNCHIGECLDISDFQIDKVEHADEMFCYCKSNHLKLPCSLLGKNLNAPNMFTHSQIDSLTLPSSGITNDILITLFERFTEKNLTYHN